LASIKDKATAIPVAAFSSGEGLASLNINQMNFEVVQFGLKGVTNYDLTYTVETRRLGNKEYIVASTEFVASLDPEWIDEIATGILEINAISETEAKNSAE
jgi:hypothetical protein